MSYKLDCPHIPDLDDAQLEEALKKEFGSLDLHLYKPKNRREKLLFAILTRKVFQLNKTIAGLEFAAEIGRNNEAELSEILDSILAGDFHTATL